MPDRIRVEWTPYRGVRDHLRDEWSSLHDRPTPIVVAWDEDHGWAVGLQHAFGHLTRRYLHPDSMPTPDEIARFVVGLALGQVPDATGPDTTGPETSGPETTDRSGTPRLHLVT